MTERDQPAGTIVPFDDLEHSAHAHEFVGGHGDVPFSVIAARGRSARRMGGLPRWAARRSIGAWARSADAGGLPRTSAILRLRRR